MYVCLFRTMRNSNVTGATRHGTYMYTCLFKSINEFCPGFEDMELRQKFVYILKHENRKLAKFLIKACDSRRNLLYENV